MNTPSEKDIKTAVYIALAIAVVFIIYKLTKGASGLIGSIFGGPTPEQIAASTTTENAIKDLVANTKTIKPTRSAAQWALVADVIYNALKTSAISDDKAKAYTELAKVLNDADMALLITAFGRRQEYNFGFPIGNPQTLPEIVAGNFSQSDIDSLNMLYSKSKMKWKF